MKICKRVRERKTQTQKREASSLFVHTSFSFQHGLSDTKKTAFLHLTQKGNFGRLRVSIAFVFVDYAFSLFLSSSLESRTRWTVQIERLLFSLLFLPSIVPGIAKN